MNNDLSAMVARIEDLEQRHTHDQLTLQSMVRQLEECAEARATAERVLAKVEQQMEKLESNYRALLTEYKRQKADREFSV